MRIVDFTDSFEKNDEGKNIIHVFFRPLRVQVKGVAVDGLFNPIGAEGGWPA
ncbi:MAG: hypothetical protein R2883_08625 [Caldisericia bacterium]